MSKRAGKLNAAVESNKEKLDREAKAIARQAGANSVRKIEGLKRNQIKTWSLNPSDEDACEDYLYKQVEAEFAEFLRLR